MLTGGTFYINMPAVLPLLWGILQSLDLVWCDSCVQAQDYVCKEIPTNYPTGLGSVVLFVASVGEINATVFNHTNLASVISLTMTKTGITSIAPGAFGSFQQLKILNLHDNDLSHVSSSWFSSREALETLALSNNSITALTNDSFWGLSGLSSLNLSNNQIHTITPTSFNSLDKLNHLDLSHNKLEHVSVETLLPLKGTNIHLNGNPWDCSCAVLEFAEHLRRLKEALLLENHMEVLCASPHYRRGVPVWNVSRCTNPTPAADYEVENNHTLKPGGSISPSSLIGLIVVLCALVFVICVLSVLYHKKRQQKQLLTVCPSPKDIEAKQTNNTEAVENPNTTQSFGSDRKNIKAINRPEALLKLNQTVLDSEKVSHIYQIYSTGIFQTREMGTRVRSAGPVLCRTELFTVCSKSDGEKNIDPKVKTRKDEERCTEWLEVEKKQRKNEGNEEIFSNVTDAGKEQGQGIYEEKVCRKKRNEMQRGHSENSQDENEDDDGGGGGDDELNLKAKGKRYEKTHLMEGKESVDDSLEENSEEVLHSEDEDSVFNEDIKDHVTSNLSRWQISERDEDEAAQHLDEAKNLPYLTIGTDPETQTPKEDQMPIEAATGEASSRPIRRVLTWPPTAAEWKKQWLQHQPVLNVWPQLILITEVKHQINTFPFCTASGSPERVGLESLPDSNSSRKDVMCVRTLEPSQGMCESAFQSCVQDLLISVDDYSTRTEIQPDVKPQLSADAQSDLDNNSPVTEETRSKAHSESVNPEDDSAHTKRRNGTKATDQTPKKRQTEPSSKQRWKRKGEKVGKLQRKARRDQSGPDSAAPPSGGSPSDDNLLEDNEYAFIDLLHEVVENNGRWTRERWKKSRMNKQKLKRKGKSH